MTTAGSLVFRYKKNLVQTDCFISCPYSNEETLKKKKKSAAIHMFNPNSLFCNP